MNKLRQSENFVEKQKRGENTDVIGQVRQKRDYFRSSLGILS